MENTALPQETAANETQSLAYTFLIMTSALILIGLGILLGYFLWGNKNTNQKEAQNTAVPLTPMPSGVQWLMGLQAPSPADTSAGAGNWTQYTDVTFSIKYPVTWLIKRGFSAKDDLIIYDPKSIKVSTQNGQQIKTPSSYVDILSVSPASQSALQTVSDYITAMKQKNITIQSEESPVYKSDMILFDNPVGSGKNILWSHNNIQAMFNASLNHLTDNSTENQILQTFQFMQQNGN